LSVQGIENLYQLSEQIYSGASPEGEAGFSALEKLGVKTILTVDGTLPEVERAAKHGMHYVHLPMGYDGANRSNALRIVKAAEVMPKPLFIHCHHGMHRGPTAAALVCEGLAGWSPQEAEAWLRVAGTSTNYPGLYRTVREFSRPTVTELATVSAKFNSRAKTPDLVQTMVVVDEHFDRLKALQKTGFKVSPNHPDVSAANESLMLWELFREAHRTKQGAQRGEAFMTEMLKGAENAAVLHATLKQFDANPGTDISPAETAFQNMAKTCAACHQSYRN
jgi:hypothetical protein